VLRISTNLNADPDQRFHLITDRDFGLRIRLLDPDPDPGLEILSINNENKIVAILSVYSDLLLVFRLIFPMNLKKTQILKAVFWIQIRMDPH